MKTIHKYPLVVKDRQEIEMPLGASILSVQNQNDTITIWALVRTEEPKEKVTFFIYGTGSEVAYAHDGANYIATVQMTNGLVWHVFKK